MGARCVYQCGLWRGWGLGEGGGGEAEPEEHVRARKVGGGGRVDNIQVWTRTCEYLTITWMVSGSFAVMFENDMF